MAQGVRDLAQGVAKHILDCMWAQSTDLPMEALREGLTIEEEEVAGVAICNLAIKVVGYFIPAPIDEGADDEEGEDPSATAAASVGKVSDGSSSVAMPQQPSASPSSS